MKAYRNTKLSDAQFKKLEAYIDKCQQYMDNPEFESYKVKSGFLWWRKEIEFYSLKDIPFGLGCYYVRSTDKNALKDEIEPNKVGLKLYTLCKMLSSGSEILIDDELYEVLYQVVEGGL